MGRAVVLSVLLLAACQAAPARYVGPVTGCGQSSRGLLEIHGSHVVFTPTEGLLTLQGEVTADGSLHASGALPGPAAPSMQFTGRLANGQVTGTLTGGTCTRTVALTPADTGLQQALPSHSALQGVF